MLHHEPYTFDHPHVQAEKAVFEKRRSPSVRGLFEVLFNDFHDDSLTFGKIGKRRGLTGEAIRQIYETHFIWMFDGKSGAERRATALSIKRQLTEAPFKNDPLLVVIAQRARSFGCFVENIVQKDPKQLRQLINGWHCSIRRVANNYRTHERVYGHATLPRATIDSIDAFILCSLTPGLPNRFFVVPSLVFREAYPVSPQKGKNVSIYLPTVAYTNRPSPQINYWQYLNAWHLLTPKSETAHAAPTS